MPFNLKDEKIVTQKGHVITQSQEAGKWQKRGLESGFKEVWMMEEWYSFIYWNALLGFRKKIILPAKKSEKYKK